MIKYQNVVLNSCNNSMFKIGPVGPHFGRTKAIILYCLAPTMYTVLTKNVPASGIISLDPNGNFRPSDPLT